MKMLKYTIMIIWKYKKNVNVKNGKEYVKKVNISMKNYKVTSNRNANKETNKPNKEKNM